MNKSSRSQGNVIQLVIIIILVIAVLGLIGYVVFRNLNKAPAANQPMTQSNNQTTEQAPAGQTASQSLNGYTLSYTYPTTWVKGDGTLTSPDGQTVVTLKLAVPRGIGGTCGSAAGTIEDPLTQAEWQAVPGDAKFLFSDYIVGGIGYGFGLFKTSDTIKNVKVGDSACMTYSGIPEIIILNIDDNDHDKSTIMQALTDFKQLQTASGSRKPDLTAQQINSAFNSADGVAAKNILLSIKLTTP